MSYRFDLHVHSQHSKDARGSILELAEAASEAGLHGFCITDHDTVRGHRDIDEAMEKTGQFIVPGIEVTSAEGHILAIGCRHPIKAGLGADETAAFIHQHGGVAVAAHPLRVLSGIGPTGLRRHAQQGHLFAAEGLNARERRLVQENTLRTVRQCGLSATGGSDAHWIRDIGNAYTVFDTMPGSEKELVQMIKDGLCDVDGRSTPRHSVWGHSLSLAVPPLRRRFIQK